MKLHEIENLEFQELKDRRDELAAAIASEPQEEFAKRYVQARTDAKLRDLKLSEQGETIKNLNAALESERGRAESLRADVETEKQRITAMTSAHSASVAELNSTVLSLQESLAVERQKSSELLVRAEKAESLAKDRRAALADVMSFGNQLNAKVGSLLATE